MINCQSRDGFETLLRGVTCHFFTQSISLRCSVQLATAIATPIQSDYILDNTCLYSVIARPPDDGPGGTVFFDTQTPISQAAEWRSAINISSVLSKLVKFPYTFQSPAPKFYGVK